MPDAIFLEIFVICRFQVRFLSIYTPRDFVNSTCFIESLLPAAEGRRRSCTHKTQTDKTIWRTKRTSCIYSVPMILRDEIIIFKGGGVVSVSSCLLILNTLPHCKNVVLDIYNTVETIVSVTILKILVCFTYLNFAYERGDQALTYQDYMNNLRLLQTT